MKLNTRDLQEFSAQSIQPDPGNVALALITYSQQMTTLLQWNAPDSLFTKYNNGILLNLAETICPSSAF